jgi:hypothetical protein
MDYLTSEASTINELSNSIIESVQKYTMKGGKGFFNPFGVMEQPNKIRIPIIIIAISVFCFFIIDYEEVEEEEDVKELKELY